jgi:hypothetical protein
MKRIILILFAMATLSPIYAQLNSSIQHRTDINIYAAFDVDRKSFTDSTYLDKPNKDNMHQSHNPTSEIVTQGPALKPVEYIKTYLGFRFLPTLTNLSFSNPQHGTVPSTSVLGYGFGGLYGVNFSDHAGIQAELLVNTLTQGYKEGNETRTVHINYINLPILMVINTGVSKQVNFNVAFGPQFGYNIGCYISQGPEPYEDTITAKVAVKPGDLGIAYGLGFDVKLDNSQTKLTLGYRGDFGIVDVSDASNNQTVNEYYIIQRSFLITYAAYIGLSFGF